MAALCLCETVFALLNYQGYEKKEKKISLARFMGSFRVKFVIHTVALPSE